MQPKNNLEELVKSLIDNKEILYCVLSGFEKISLKPIQIKEKLSYQVTEERNNQAFHRNLSEEEAQNLILQTKFKQALICTPHADYQVLVSKKQQVTILKKLPSKTKISLEHNRKKLYVLEEGIPVPFFVALGIMTEDGKVIAKKSDKFKQINRFLEMIQDVVPYLKNDHIRIIDFGCGKAYLTFALYHYMHIKLGLNVNIIGLDLKKEVVETCQQLAKKLNYTHLHFQIGDIKDYLTDDKVDMVVTLHACNTATDIALAKAIEWKAEVILSVPCCQHELFNQIKNEALQPLLKHGLLKERFTALVTDAARAQLLEIAGYRTQILEFIDLEHTPKNVLIRAIRQGLPKNLEQLKSDYTRFAQDLHIHPLLASSFNE